MPRCPMDCNTLILNDLRGNSGVLKIPTRRDFAPNLYLKTKITKHSESETIFITVYIARSNCQPKQ